MRVSEEKTRQAREQHERGVASLDRLFHYDRKRDGRGFLLAQTLAFLRGKRHRR